MFTFEKNAEKTTNMIVIPRFFIEKHGLYYDIIDMGDQILIKKGKTKAIIRLCKLRLPVVLIRKYGQKFYMQVFEDRIILKKVGGENVV